MMRRSFASNLSGDDDCRELCHGLMGGQCSRCVRLSGANEEEACSLPISV